MSTTDFLKKLPEAFKADAAAGTNCTIQFNVSEPAYLVIQDGNCALEEGTADSPNLGVTMEDDDLVALLKGELDGMSAFMTGKLQVEGDLMLAQQMGNFFDQSKLA
ncbi:MAG: SCP2 sterol-binding domain-containing protein [Salinisphaeraceae bacterium]|nr:SCP2 sterol-binding domain-containing protein [Salinisphaeraceae bacterium]